MTEERAVTDIELLPCPFCGNTPDVLLGEVGLVSICRACDFELLLWQWNQRTPPAAIAPQGYQLVPIEPTEEMWIRGYAAWVNGMPQKDEYRAIRCYKAMLAAAPKREDVSR